MKNILILVALIAVAFLLWWWLMPTEPEVVVIEEETATTTEPTEEEPILTGNFCEDIRTQYATSSEPHVVLALATGASMESGDVVEGCVYSYATDSYDGWAPFEAQIGSFELRASDNTLLASGPLPVIMSADWMADAMAGLPLRFQSDPLTLSPHSYTAGTLTIYNENASGEPANARSVSIPVSL